MAPPTTITVFDNVYGDNGAPLVGTTVTCVLDSAVETFASGLIAASTQSTVTDGNGRFAFTLIPNDLLTPLNSTYTIQIPSIGRTYQIAPQSGNGSSQQSTAANVIVNTPAVLALQPTLSGTYSGAADFAIRSITTATSPTTPTAVSGGADFGAAVRISGGDPWFDVTHPTYGADKTGTNDSTTAISAAITAAQAATTGGIVWLPAGTYKVTGALTTITSHGVSVEGAGSITTQINFSGSGDCFRIAHTADSTANPSGRFRGFTIDGTSAGAAGVGVHLGDMNGFALEDVSIQNFTGATAVGLWLDNTAFWTERLTLYRFLSSNNTKGIKYTVNGGSTSFGYHRYLDLRFLVKDSQIGLSVEGGQVYNALINAIVNVSNTATPATVISMNGGTLTGSGDLTAEQAGGSNVFLSTAASPNPSFTFDGTITYGAMTVSLGAAGTWVEFTAFSQQTNQSGAVTYDVGALKSPGWIEIKVTGNITGTTLSNLRKGQIITLGYQQVAPGSFTIVPPTAKYAAGAAPTFSTTSTWQDFITYQYDGTNLWEIARSVGDH